MGAWLENGPYELNANNTWTPKNTSWNLDFHMLFID